MAWSTPGAALLAGAAIPAAGWAGAVGAFAFAGLLYLLTAVVRPLGTWVSRIPAPIASGMLAGVLLTLCVAPFRALADDPATIAPVLLTWLVLLRVARRWAVPGALLTAGVVIAVAGQPLPEGSLLPALTWTAPVLDWGAVVAIGLPLYLVTMTGQNIPGVAVLESFGYRAPLRPALGWAGVATVATAPAGGYSINLAAISAALAAGPEAGPDPRRRWIAGVAAAPRTSAWPPSRCLSLPSAPRPRRASSPRWPGWPCSGPSPRRRPRRWPTRGTARPGRSPSWWPRRGSPSPASARRSGRWSSAASCSSSPAPDSYDALTRRLVTLPAPPPPASQG